MGNRAHPPGERSRIIGNNLRTLREQAEVSQRALADAVGSGQQVIAKLEAGDMNLRVELLLDLASALDVTVGDLLAGVEP